MVSYAYIGRMGFLNFAGLGIVSITMTNIYESKTHMT